MMAISRLHQLFRNMEVVGKLQEYDKLSTVRQDFYIDKPSYSCACMRMMRGDRYDLNVQSIESNIDELIRGVVSLNDPGYVLRAVEHLRRAQRGLVNLERTYIDRVQAQAAILVLRQDLEVRITNLIDYKNRDPRYRYTRTPTSPSCLYHGPHVLLSLDDGDGDGDGEDGGHEGGDVSAEAVVYWRDQRSRAPTAAAQR